MKSARTGNIVTFTTKGQIVIPSALRTKYEIKPGTRAVVQETADGILLRPVGKQSIRQLHGILKRKKGSPSLTKEWAEHKREERELENRRGR